MPPETVKPPHSFRRSVWEWAKVIVIALVIALPIRFFIAEPFVVNGASMDPTFSTGEFLIVDRLTYDFEKPQRGQVVVFRYPGDPSIYYIKRIIGLPGETVCLNDGQVSISTSTPPACPGPLSLDQPFVAADHASHDTGTYTLTASQYFVMGDNRAQSADSRLWGPLPANLIIGQPLLRLTPLSAISFWPGTYHETLSK